VTIENAMALIAPIALLWTAYPTKEAAQGLHLEYGFLYCNGYRDAHGGLRNASLARRYPERAQTVPCFFAGCGLQQRTSASQGFKHASAGIYRWLDLAPACYWVYPGRDGWFVGH